MMPIIEKISRIRDVFFSRTPKDDSMTPPPFESIRNWNSADEFMDGAWTAYNEAIRAILLSADKELMVRNIAPVNEWYAAKVVSCGESAIQVTYP